MIDPSLFGYSTFTGVGSGKVIEDMGGKYTDPRRNDSGHVFWK
jgi:hypothetical protein